MSNKEAVNVVLSKSTNHDNYSIENEKDHCYLRIQSTFEARVPVSIIDLLKRLNEEEAELQDYSISSIFYLFRNVFLFIYFGIICYYFVLANLI